MCGYCVAYRKYNTYCPDITVYWKSSVLGGGRGVKEIIVKKNKSKVDMALFCPLLADVTYQALNLSTCLTFWNQLLDTQA